MNETQKIKEWIHELTEFCIKHRGRCFKDWSRERIFLYLFGSSLMGILHVLRDDNQNVDGVFIASKATEENVVFAQIVGNRNSVGKAFQISRKLFPNAKKWFTYRRGKFVEIHSIHRFCTQ